MVESPRPIDVTEELPITPPIEDGDPVVEKTVVLPVQPVPETNPRDKALDDLYYSCAAYMRSVRRFNAAQKNKLNVKGISDRFIPANRKNRQEEIEALKQETEELEKDVQERWVQASQQGISDPITEMFQTGGRNVEGNEGNINFFKQRVWKEWLKPENFADNPDKTTSPRVIIEASRNTREPESDESRAQRPSETEEPKTQGELYIKPREMKKTEEDENEKNETGKSTEDEKKKENKERDEAADRLEASLGKIENKEAREFVKDALLIREREKSRLKERYGNLDGGIFGRTAALFRKLSSESSLGRFAHGLAKTGLGLGGVVSSGMMGGTPGMLLSPTLFSMGIKTGAEGLVQMAQSFLERKVNREIGSTRDKIGKLTDELQKSLSEENIDFEKIKNNANQIKELEADLLDMDAARSMKRAKFSVQNMIFGTASAGAAALGVGLPTGFQTGAGIGTVLGKEITSQVSGRIGHYTSFDLLKGWMFEYTKGDLGNKALINAAHKVTDANGHVREALYHTKTIGLAGKAGHGMSTSGYALGTYAKLAGGIGIAGAAIYLSARHDKKSRDKLMELAKSYQEEAKKIREKGELGVKKPSDEGIVPQENEDAPKTEKTADEVLEKTLIMNPVVAENGTDQEGIIEGEDYDGRALGPYKELFAVEDITAKNAQTGSPEIINLGDEVYYANVSEDGEKLYIYKVKGDSSEQNKMEINKNDFAKLRFKPNGDRPTVKVTEEPLEEAQKGESKSELPKEETKTSDENKSEILLVDGEYDAEVKFVKKEGFVVAEIDKKNRRLDIQGVEKLGLKTGDNVKIKIISVKNEASNIYKAEIVDEPDIELGESRPVSPEVEIRVADYKRAVTEGAIWLRANDYKGEGITVEWDTGSPKTQRSLLLPRDGVESGFKFEKIVDGGENIILSSNKYGHRVRAKTQEFLIAFLPEKFASITDDEKIQEERGFFAAWINTKYGNKEPEKPATPPETPKEEKLKEEPGEEESAYIMMQNGDGRNIKVGQKWGMNGGESGTVTFEVKKIISTGDGTNQFNISYFWVDGEQSGNLVDEKDGDNLVIFGYPDLVLLDDVE